MRACDLVYPANIKKTRPWEKSGSSEPSASRPVPAESWKPVAGSCLLEIERRRYLQQPRREGVLRSKPLVRPLTGRVVEIRRGDRRLVEDVVQVQAHVRPVLASPKDLPDAKIELVDAVVVLRLGFDQRDVGCGSCRNLAGWQSAQAALRDRSGDVGINCLVRSTQLDSWSVLICRTHLHIDLADGVGPEELQLREPGLLHMAEVERDRCAGRSAWIRQSSDEQRFNDRRPVAELAGIRRVDDVAVIERLPAGAGPTLEDHAAWEPRVETDIEAVPVIDDLAPREEVLGEADEVRSRSRIVHIVVLGRDD